MTVTRPRTPLFQTESTPRPQRLVASSLAPWDAVLCVSSEPLCLHLLSAPQNPDTHPRPGLLSGHVGSGVEMVTEAWGGRWEPPAPSPVIKVDRCRCLRLFLGASHFSDENVICDDSSSDVATDFLAGADTLSSF